MAEVKTREEIMRAWWATWRTWDYSWAGLAKRPVGERDGHRVDLEDDKTLQAYWRRDPVSGALRDDAALAAAGELVELDGVVFHIVHLPPETVSGVKSWKADLSNPNWARLEEILAARLGAAAETRFDALRNAEGGDRRAQLAGAILRRAVEHPLGRDHSLHVHCRLTLTLGEAHYHGKRFGPGAYFGSAAFSEEAFVLSSGFGDNADFGGAIFLGEAVFRSVSFAGEANFSDATFFGHAGFGASKFSEGAFFSGTAFLADTEFHSAVFSADAIFSSTMFAKYADFTHVAFSARAGFSNATFSHDVRFLGAVFSGDVAFTSAAFSGKSVFDSATFSAAADFTLASFAGLAYFNAAKFKGDMNFGTATFAKLASFEQIVWPTDARHWHQAFDQTRFGDTLAMTNSGLYAFAAFDGAMLKEGLQFDDAPEGEAKKSFRTQLAAALAAPKQDGEAFERETNEILKIVDRGNSTRVSRSEIRAHVAQQREERLKQLERGCRVLKQAMEKASNKSREQVFYRFELQARRAQRGLPPGEALFSDLYGATSDYGASMARPFVTLGLLIAFFTAVFFAAALGLGLIGSGQDQVPHAAAWWHAFDLSWANVFKPLSALTADGTPTGSLGEKLLSHSPLVGSALRIAATLQSLLAIVLAFLFALAVRRRFQIS